MRKKALFNLEIKKKSGSSINPDIHHLKVPSSGKTWSILGSAGKVFERICKVERKTQIKLNFKILSCISERERFVKLNFFRIFDVS